MPQEPPETIPLDDDEELELGVCWGCARLDDDEEPSSELVAEEELVSEEFEDAAEFDDDVAW